MHYTIHTTTIDLTCTFADLAKMDTLDMALYATPNTLGDVSDIYMGREPHFQDDFLVATIEDFLAEAGLSSLGLQEMSEEEEADVQDDEYTLTVSRRKPLVE